MAVVALALIGGASRPTLAQAPETPSRPARPATRPTFSYVIDLARPSPPSTVLVPDGHHLDVRLANLAVKGRYRHVYEGEGPRDVAKPFVPALSTRPLAEACEAIKKDVLAALAADEETTVASLARGADSRLEAANCPPDQKSFLKYALDALNPSLGERRLLRPGGVLALTVDRIDPSSDAPLRSWKVSFRGAAPDLGWAHPTEESYLVQVIGGELAEMALFSAARTQAVTVTVKAADLGAGATGPRYDVRVNAPGIALVRRIVLTPHVWAPEAYASLAGDLVEHAAKGRSGKAAAPRSALDALVNPTAGVLAAESDRVSKRLTTNPRDAEAHEQAALILGAFTLREAAREHSDVRVLLSRMTSHLALAGALRRGAPASRDRRFASIILSVVTGRQPEALKELSALEETKPTAAEAAWIKALSIRTHGDWRQLAAPPRATLVERLAYFQAVTAADSASRALDELSETALEPIPDWSRFALARVPFSLSEGQRFALGAVRLELEDLTQAWKSAHGTPARSEELVAALALSPGHAVQRPGTPSIQVLDWATWGAAAARHVKAHVDAADRLLRRLLGDKDSAAEFARIADRMLASVPQYALVLERRVRSGPSTAGFCEAMAGVVRSAPEAVTVANWDLAGRVCGGTTGFTGYSSWFSPPIPTGTAFDAEHRLRAQHLMREDWAGHLERLRALAPYDPVVLIDYLWRTKRPDPKEVAKEFGTLAEYQLSAMRRILTAYKGDATGSRQVLENMCAFSADACLELGRFLQASDAAAAAAAYERAIDRARDRIRVSNSVEWLVGHYHDDGRTARAMQVATMAAETYSDAGLGTMMSYLERLGRYEEAAEYARRRAERYDKPEVLDLFLIKHRDRLDPAGHSARIEAAFKRVFPQGLEKVGLPDFVGPADGPILVDQEPAVRKWGLSEGDVLVALDGYRVHTHSQYGAVKSWSAAPKMRLIVWHDGKYVEIEGDRSEIVYFHRSAAVNATLVPPGP